MLLGSSPLAAFVPEQRLSRDMLEPMPSKGFYLRSVPFTGDSQGSSAPAFSDFASECQGAGRFGGGLDLRFGHSIGSLAPELAFIAYGDFEDFALTYDQIAASNALESRGPARREQFTVLRYGLFTGLGLRLGNPTPPLRLSLGAVAGIAVTSHRYARVATPVPGRSSAAIGSRALDEERQVSPEVHSASPALVLDFTLHYQSRGGPVVLLGFAFFATTNSDPVVYPARSSCLGADAISGKPVDWDTPAVRSSARTVLYTGPTLGVWFDG